MLLVKDIIGSSSNCSTGQLDGLNAQLLARLVAKNKLIKIDHPLIICEGRQNLPYLQPLAYKNLVKAVEYANRRLVINSCLRTVMQQFMIYRQYQLNICGITAAAIPGRSNHQSGGAIDITDYLYWRPILQRFYFKWLGSWDRWHYDFIGKKESLGELQILEWQHLWNLHNPNHQIKADGIWGKKTAKSILDSPIDGFNRPLILRKGDIRYEVGQLQFLLRQALNIPNTVLKADCKFGSTTFKAVQMFQRKYGLLDDGVVGEKTIAKLEAVTGRELSRR